MIGLLMVHMTALKHEKTGPCRSGEWVLATDMPAKIIFELGDVSTKSWTLSSAHVHESLPSRQNGDPFYYRP